MLKFSEVGFLGNLLDLNAADTQLHEPITFSEDDDLDLCLYYLRSLSNVLRSSGDVSWSVLATKHVSFAGERMHISSKAPLQGILSSPMLT